MAIRALHKGHSNRLTYRVCLMILVVFFSTMVTSCVNTTVSRISVSPFSFTQADIEKVFSIIRRHGLVPHEDRHKVANLVGKTYFTSREPHLTIALWRSAKTESQVEVVFVEAGFGFPEEVVVLYRSIANELSEAFGPIHVVPDVETSRGQTLLRALNLPSNRRIDADRFAADHAGR